MDSFNSFFKFATETEVVTIDNIKLLVAYLVASSAFVSWMIFLPQFRLLKKVKDSRSISTGTVWGSLTLQLLILTNSIFKHNWQLTMALCTTITCLVIMLPMIYYYRKWPGGRQKASDSNVVSLQSVSKATATMRRK